MAGRKSKPLAPIPVTEPSSNLRIEERSFTNRKQKRYTGVGRSSRESLKLAIRRREAVELHMSGMTQDQISKALGYARSTVTRDLHISYMELRRACLHNLEAHRQRELDRIDLIELEAWAAWERSQQPEEYETKSSGGELKNPKTTLVTKPQVGDPRFLEIVQRCVADRRKILGLDEPTKSESKVTADVSIGLSFVPRSQMRQVVKERFAAITAVKEPSPN